ncbi:MAG: histidine kinase [Vicinamibacterales bacterium]|nr:histidine kinase [Vicinamibacterales bacterium]
MSTPGSSVRRRLLSPGPWLLWGAAVFAWGLLLFSYRYLAVLAQGHWEPFGPTLIDEMTGGLAFGLIYFPLRALVWSYPLHHPGWRRRVPLYVGALFIAAPAVTSILWATRLVLYPLAGLGRYDYGVMPLRYFMEFPIQLIGFSVMVFVLHAVDAYREANERRLREAEIERALAEAQLRNLRLQLQPHFLFNALNTISSTLYRDPKAADELLEQLGELLRASLRTGQVDEVALRDELLVLSLYVSLMKARFGDALSVDVAVEPGVDAAVVPSMILQPLVENAIRHGGITVRGAGTITVRARRDGDRLLLEVGDDGPGPAGEAPGRRGVGLTATAERLALLYGPHQDLTTGKGPDGGFVATVSLPFHTVPAHPPGGGSHGAGTPA